MAVPPPQDARHPDPNRATNRFRQGVRPAGGLELPVWARAGRFSLVLVGVAAFGCASVTERIGSSGPSSPKTNGEVEFDIDAPPPTRYEVAPGLTFGAKVEVELESERNLDLDDRDNEEDETSLSPELSVALSYDPTPGFRAFAEIELSDEHLLEAEPGENSSKAGLVIEQAYLTAREIMPGLSIQLGRQRFADSREWLYDDELDAARVYYRLNGLGFELSASREALFDEDLLNDDDVERINNYGLRATTYLADDISLEAYVLVRDNRETESDSEDLVFVGLHSEGEIVDSVDYWLELAYVHGDTDTADIRGWGIDLGATFVADLPYKPSATLGFAFGTGDSDPNDDVDHAFRQSGLHDNSDKFNGVTSFQYYGETLDPELSNLMIFTAGAGIRPSKRSSVDLVYHYYLQHKAQDELRDAEIDEDPSGRNRELGHGFDIVAGYRGIPDLDLELVLSTFVPGKAFDGPDDPAYFLGLEAQYKF